MTIASEKPRQVFKRSGETVKPALRESSQISGAPTTTATRKKVHFNEDLEQVRHFFQEEILNRELLPSNELSIKPTQWEATVTNYTMKAFDGDRHFVRLKNLSLSTDCQNLIGTVNVANIAFEKQVTARFTIDNWEIISEVTAEYKEPVEKYDDQFQFTIAVPTQANLHAKRVMLCIRYRVNGQEFWDNSGKNYFVKFTRKVPLLKSNTFDDCDMPRRHLNGRFSGRYNFPTSMRVTNILLATRKPTQSTEGQKHFSASSTPMNYNWSKWDLHSPDYSDMIQRLCYFKPGDTTDSFDGLTRLIYPLLTDRNTRLSQAQSLHNSSVYPNQSFQISRVTLIHCC
jgi:hypothetical protein